MRFCPKCGELVQVLEDLLTTRCAVCGDVLREGREFEGEDETEDESDG
jgi:hypothetical protein